MKGRKQTDIFEFLENANRKQEKAEKKAKEKAVWKSDEKPKLKPEPKQLSPEEMFINPKTHVFNRGKYEGQPIWDVVLVNPDYISWLYYDSEIDEESRADIEEEIKAQPDKYGEV